MALPQRVSPRARARPTVLALLLLATSSCYCAEEVDAQRLKLIQARGDSGDVVAALISKHHSQLVKKNEENLRSKWKEQARLAKQQQRVVSPAFNGWTFSPPQLPGVTVRASTQRGTGSDNATYAVFKSSTGNEYRYKLERDEEDDAGRVRRRSLGNRKERKRGGNVNATSSYFPTPPQTGCAWQAYVTGRRFNLAYPDLSAVYQVLVQLNMKSKDIIRIQGRFPQARYFSIQSYNAAEGAGIDTLRDFEIQPDPGSINPFVGGSITDPNRNYTIHVSLRRQPSLSNSLALCPAGSTPKSCSSATALIVVRIYTADPDAPESNCFTDPPDTKPIPRLWGYERAPSVSYLFKSRFDRRSGKTTYQWKGIPTCDPTQPTVISEVLDTYISWLVPDYGPPTYANLRDNFFLYLGTDAAQAQEGQSQQSVPFVNLDATYLIAVGHQQSLANQGLQGRLFARVHGKWPNTAQNWKASPLIPSWSEYDVRYNSLSSVAFIEGAPTIDTLNDVQLRYRAKEAGGAAGKLLESEGGYSVVVGESKERSCGLFSADKDMFLRTTLASKGGRQDYWGIIFRQLISRYQRNKEADKSVGYARTRCTGNGKDMRNCSSPAFLEEAMGDFYPHIDWFVCSYDSVTDKPTLTPITKTLQSTLPPA